MWLATVPPSNGGDHLSAGVLLPRRRCTVSLGGVQTPRAWAPVPSSGPSHPGNYLPPSGCTVAGRLAPTPLPHLNMSRAGRLDTDVVVRRAPAPDHAPSAYRRTANRLARAASRVG
jgi:hypothetical protein